MNSFAQKIRWNYLFNTIIDIDMQRYKNIAGNSGVVSYETGNDFVEVRFKGIPQVYRYSYQSAGRANVEKAKQLGKSGKGLSGFISQNMKHDFE